MFVSRHTSLLSFHTTAVKSALILTRMSPRFSLSVARSLPCPQKRNISPRRCLNSLRFLVFDSETADEPVSHEKSHFPLPKL